MFYHFFWKGQQRTFKNGKFQKALYKKQLGFQKSFSIAHAVIRLIGNIEKAIHNKAFVCGIFVDLQKAFDTVDHNILFHKLPH